MNLTAAEGFAELGLWEDAWHAIEDLEPQERMTPAVLMLRLRCCAKLGQWELGDPLAELLRHGEGDSLTVAAGYYHAHAVYCFSRGDAAGARRWIESAIDTFPAARQMILEDKRLEGLDN